MQGVGQGGLLWSSAYEPDGLPGSAPSASSEGSLTLASPGRSPLRSGVPPPDPRPPGGPHPIAQRVADGVGLGVTLFITSLALGFAPAPFSLLGTPLGFQGAPLCLLGDRKSVV